MTELVTFMTAICSAREKSRKESDYSKKGASDEEGTHVNKVYLSEVSRDTEGNHRREDNRS